MESYDPESEEMKEAPLPRHSRSLRDLDEASVGEIDTSYVQDADAGLVVLMGMTGSGKTTFVSRLTGHGCDEVGIGHSLTSQTIHATHYTATDSNGRKVHILDTPGFGDTTRSDAEILNEIANQLTTSYENGERLLGIIFLQRITDVRLSHSAIRSFHILQRLVGPANYGCVTLATTMWSNTAFMGGGFPSAVKRQKQLQGYWDDLFDRKSRVVRHHNTAESAWEIIESLGAGSNNEGSVKLKIQSELVDDGLGLGQTWAGRYLQEEGVQDAVLSVKEIQPPKPVKARHESRHGGIGHRMAIFPGIWGMILGYMPLIVRLWKKYYKRAERRQIAPP